ncbi:hypothetical protein D3C57_119490 [Streptomyces rapamycinicus NRRL 5491]|uniref:Uncharacterized protein n=1 Tax=Streptomyces rapamycinicus (strain ATCC 29253 / DSM 41530 / NRRL 5491 / AYB-994) TaxID=1343740 RepID=A0A3L8RLJ1_STRRN|nr:hypothetical protein D3C57_119490 [Streptomyces rapamycinicus NRRL 5491]
MRTTKRRRSTNSRSDGCANGSPEVPEERFKSTAVDLVAEETGLTQDQIKLGVLWQNLGALRWLQRFGKGQGPEPAG